MIARKLILTLLALTCIVCEAGAQSYGSFGRENNRNSGGAIWKTPDVINGPRTDPKSGVVSKEKYTDPDLQKLDEQMKERDWTSENTAWERACIQDSKDSYQRYLAIYPQGAHWTEATQRLIDKKVQDMLDHAHEEFPGLKHVETDDESETSVIVIDNHTAYILTVFFSGDASKSVNIGPGGRTTVTLPNGQYKVAASVPPSHVRPFAGKTSLEGGRYETGFYIVHGY